MSRKTKSGRTFVDNESRWQAIVDRDPRAEGKFFYSVRTTGVYCRPTCAAKLPLRKNVGFHLTCKDAERAGFRPCRRCQPAGESMRGRHAAAVARACRLIEEAQEMPSLAELAETVGMSPSHFHRIFKMQTGLTPKHYAAAQRTKRVRSVLAKSRTVTEAIYSAGFHSNSRFYESSKQMLGMTPKAFQAGGKGTAIRFAVGKSWLGTILVAASEKGVCAILLGDDPEALARDLQDRFPQAQLIGGDADFERIVARVIGFLEMPEAGLELPLDIRGTAFQQRVWKALQAIPLGSTASYSDIARQIGRPKSVRAVGQACGANPLAVAIPCHRVVRTDGTLSGYRWGIERKEKLLRREQQRP